MKTGFYCRLGFTTMKNNRQFYLPYLLMSIVSAMMFYCMRVIQVNEGIRSMRGSKVLLTILSFGLAVIALCVCIFLFYTNSFLMKRRKKELGMYNLLGMEKKHIISIMFWETCMLFAVSLILGLLSGILFHKLLSMFLYRLTGLPETIPFYVSWDGCTHTLELFSVIYFVIFLYNIFQIKSANPIELLQSQNTGEREPKTKRFLAACGIICIAAGYYLAITTTDILRLVDLFLLAVLLVIIGTYALFTTGSIALLKYLRSKKNYYYRTKHFIAVSGMLYRMKQNAIGLASICILSTMVLVMISATVSMYAGTEDTLNDRCKTELSLTFSFDSMPDAQKRQAVLDDVEQVIQDQKRNITNLTDFTSLRFLAQCQENRLEFIESKGIINIINLKEMVLTVICTKEDYEKDTGEKLSGFNKGSVVVSSSSSYMYDTINLYGREYLTAQTIALKENGNALNRELIDSIGGIIRIVVADEEELADLYKLIQTNMKQPLEMQFNVWADIDGKDADKAACAEALTGYFQTSHKMQPAHGFYSFNCISKAQERKSEIEVNGGFFFLGLFLGILFLFITVLIIYYKQISEGYEDRERFAIMEKVGLSREEIKTAIRSQVRIVFFLPLAGAVIHLAAAFPMLKRMLVLMNYSNGALFIWCLIGTVAVFAVIYYIVFKVTSVNYYRIVQ